jgi:hypothetical protein
MVQVVVEELVGQPVHGLGVLVFKYHGADQQVPLSS